MDGAHAMSTAWAPAPGQTWLAAAASFLVLWLAMMAAMMLPSFVPMLRRYRQAVRARTAVGALRLAALTAVVGAGYFAVWGALGAVVYAGGAGVTAVVARWHHPSGLGALGASGMLIVAGALQLSRWKARRLACCRDAAERRAVRDAGARTALRRGLRLGVDCVSSCAPLTAMLLAVGVMDLRAMAAVTAAITAERLAPAGQRVARAVGAIVVAGGVVLIVRASVLG